MSHGDLEDARIRIQIQAHVVHLHASKTRDWKASNQTTGPPTGKSHGHRIGHHHQQHRDTNRMDDPRAALAMKPGFGLHLHFTLHTFCAAFSVASPRSTRPNTAPSRSTRSRQLTIRY